MKGKQTTTRIIWRTGRENVESWAGNEFGTKHKGLVEKRRCKALGVHRRLITFPVIRDYRDNTIRTDVVQLHHLVVICTRTCRRRRSSATVVFAFRPQSACELSAVNRNAKHVTPNRNQRYALLPVRN